MQISFDPPFRDIELAIMACEYEEAWQLTCELEEQELKDLFFERIFVLELPKVDAHTRKFLQTRVQHVVNDELRTKLKIALIETELVKGCLDTGWARQCFIPGKEEKKWAERLCGAVDQLKEMKVEIEISYRERLEKEILTEAEKGRFEVAHNKLRVYMARAFDQPEKRWNYIAFRILLMQGDLEKAEAYLKENVPLWMKHDYGLDIMLKVHKKVEEQAFLEALQQATELSLEEQSHSIIFVVEKAIKGGHSVEELVPLLEKIASPKAKEVAMSLIENIRPDLQAKRKDSAEKFLSVV